MLRHVVLEQGNQHGGTLRVSGEDERTALVQVVEVIVKRIGGVELRNVVDDGAIVRAGLRHGDLAVVGHEDVAALVEHSGLNLTNHLRTSNHHRVGELAHLGFGTETGNGRVDVEHVDGLQAVSGSAVEHAILDEGCGHVEPVLSLVVVNYAVVLLYSDDVLRSFRNFANSRGLCGLLVTTLARSKVHGYQHHRCQEHKGIQSFHRFNF